MVGALPAPRQAGGGTIKRMQSILSDDDDSDEDAASSVFDSRGAPSPLEKVLLLRDTKMLRFAVWNQMSGAPRRQRDAVSAIILRITELTG